MGAVAENAVGCRRRCCGAETRILLNDVQEDELWLQVLAQDEAGKQTISVAGLAQQARQAWRAMHQYRIDLREFRNDDNIDAKAFSRWAVELEKVCRRAQLLSSSQIESELAKLVRDGKVPLPENDFSWLDSIGQHPHRIF